jgi:hypothetical protein
MFETWSSQSGSDGGQSYIPLKVFETQSRKTSACLSSFYYCNHVTRRSWFRSVASLGVSTKKVSELVYVFDFALIYVINAIVNCSLAEHDHYGF